MLCGLPSCPIMTRFRSIVRVATAIADKDEVSGSTPPSAVVGESGYPKVRVIVGVPPNVTGSESKEYENPKGWWGKKSLNEIIELRSSLVSASINKVRVDEPWRLYEKEISLASVSTDPVQLEVKSDSKILPKLKFDGVLMPRGPSMEAKDITVVDDPKVPRKLEALIFDDVKAEDAIRELYLSGEDVYTIIPALSLGLLGLKKNRKLVPTRWAITATDSALGKFLLEEVREFEEVNEVQVFYSAYLGNRFFVILFPSKYRGVWVEIWHPMSLWASEPVVVDLYENFWGEYDMLDGGYMAARLGVLEYMYRIRRQAGFVIVREVTKDYYAPVGNWHIRETVRRAFNNLVFKTSDLKKALDYVMNNLQLKVDLFGIESVKKLVAQKDILSLFDDKGER